MGQVETMFKKFKNIQPGVLLSHVIITLAYPAVKAFLSPNRRLLIFTDAMTIVALVLVILGIVYTMVLHGDFDIGSYFLQRGGRSLARFFTRSGKEEASQKDLAAFLRDAREKREEAFNYPLFLGVVYLIAAGVLAYGFLS